MIGTKKPTFILQIPIHRRKRTPPNLPLQQPRIITLHHPTIMQNTNRLKEPRPRAKLRRRLSRNLHSEEHRQQTILPNYILVLAQKPHIRQTQDGNNMRGRDDVSLVLDLELPQSDAIGVDDVKDGARRPDGANVGVGHEECPVPGGELATVGEHGVK